MFKHIQSILEEISMKLNAITSFNLHRKLMYKY